MKHIESDIENQIYRYIYNEISISEIESWLNITILKANVDMDNRFLSMLIGFNFKQKDAKYSLKESLKEVWLKAYSEEITYERIRRIIRDIINETIPVHVACHELSGLYYSGYDNWFWCNN